MPNHTVTNEERLSVRVRMYTQGLGDCFLLTFSRGPEKINMLIDCGVLQGTENAPQKMSEIVKDIKQETGGDDESNGRLDVVVATHEHWDHISGFSQARADFDQIDFDTIWLGWTEDPDDLQASELKKKQEARREAIKKAKETKKSSGLDSLFRLIDNLLDFEWPDTAEPNTAPAGDGNPSAATGGVALQRLFSSAEIY